MFRLAQEIMHQLALLPLGVMLVTVSVRRFTMRQWTLGAVFAVSWLMDSTWIMLSTAGQGPAFVITQYGMAVQIAAVLALFVRRETLYPLLAGLALLVAAVALQGVVQPREFVVPLIGGFVVSLYAWRIEASLTRSALVVYFGVGGFAWTWWALAVTQTSWYGYQMTRLVGLALVTAALVAHTRRPRMELV